jgi:hypothetical protein
MVNVSKHAEIEATTRKENVMSATLIPSPQTSRSAPQDTRRRIVIALAAFVVIAGIGLGIALIAGATAVFNVLVFVLFAVLWLSFAAALVLSPGTLDEIWRQTRRLPLIVQAVVWLLFLPLMIGLWIWEREWSLVVRLVLVLGIGFANIFMFLPRSL